MNKKNKVLVCIVLGLLIFSLATIIWAYQNGKITIFGSEKSTQSVFNYNTREQWANGQFQNTLFTMYPDHLSLKFIYDSAWKPPFSEAAAKCETLTAKCIGGGIPVITVSKTGGFAWTNDQVNFYGDGKVIKSSMGIKSEAQKISTCFTADEMAELLALIESSDFWNANISPAPACADCFVYTIKVNLLNKQKTVTWDTAQIPEKIYELYSTLYLWPDYHANLIDQSIIPACGSLAGKTPSFSDALPGCAVNNCKPNQDVICTQEYAPVCGYDGKTYGNKCDAGTNCAKIACMGKCPCPERNNCFPKSGWGGYVGSGYYISDKIGSESIANFQKFEIDPVSLYLPSDAKISFQFAGSKDNFQSWSDELTLATARCGESITDTSHCIGSKYSINLSDLGVLKNSKYLKVRINFEAANSTSASISNSSKATLKYSPLLSGFNVVGTNTDYDTIPPSEVNNIRTSEVTANSVRLAWDASTDPSGIAKYHIYRTKFTNQTKKNNNFIRSAKADMSLPLINEVGTTGELGFNVMGLEPNTRYQFLVIAEDGAGVMGPWSDILGVTTLSQNNPDPNPVPVPPPPAPSPNPWSNLGRLVSTGSSLTVNLTIAAVLTLILSYIILRRRADY